VLPEYMNLVVISSGPGSIIPELGGGPILLILSWKVSVATALLIPERLILKIGSVATSHTEGLPTGVVPFLYHWKVTPLF
jgi:hypothetical protein